MCHTYLLFPKHQKTEEKEPFHTMVLKTWTPDILLHSNTSRGIIEAPVRLSYKGYAGKNTDTMIHRQAIVVRSTCNPETYAVDIYIYVVHKYNSFSF